MKGTLASSRIVGPPAAGLSAHGLTSAQARAPSIYLPLRFVLTGMGSLFVAMGLLVLRPELLSSYHYNQFVVAVTHLMTLGWIGSVVMGAMYQLVPVALETTLYSERLGRWQYLLHLIGVIGMVSMFWVWDMKQVGYFGAVFGLGVGLFVYNLGRTLARIRRWNVIAAAIASALFWLVLAVLMGLFVAASKHWPWNFFAPLAQMHAHAHLGVVGFFLVMTVGVSLKLLPMFALSEIQSQRRAWWTVLLLNLGLAGAFPAILLESRWKLAFALVIVAGLVIYCLELRAILRARKRRALDWGLRYFLTALGVLLPVTTLGVILAWPGMPLTVLTGQLENIYGFLALTGVLSFAILGMLYKIVPFLVWYARYSNEIGRQKVPSLADLYSSGLQALGYWCYVGGLAIVSAAMALSNPVAVRWSCGLLLLSLAFFASNMARILSHMVKPRVEPLPLKTPGLQTRAA